jgi:hypothetical protein
VEDSENVDILHSEYFLLSRKTASETQKISFTIPIPKSNLTVDELPAQIFVRSVMFSVLLFIVYQYCFVLGI